MHNQQASTTARDLFPGALEMMVLEVLRRAPAHGYALAQQIHARSNHLLQVQEGSLYPALQRLLKKRLVEAEWELSPTQRRIRVYRITSAGESSLQGEVQRFEQMLAGIQLVLKPVQP